MIDDSAVHQSTMSQKWSVNNSTERRWASTAATKIFSTRQRRLFSTAKASVVIPCSNQGGFTRFIRTKLQWLGRSLLYELTGWGSWRQDGEPVERDPGVSTYNTGCCVCHPPPWSQTLSSKFTHHKSRWPYINESLSLLYSGAFAAVLGFISWMYSLPDSLRGAGSLVVRALGQ